MVHENNLPKTKQVFFRIVLIIIILFMIFEVSVKPDILFNNFRLSRTGSTRTVIRSIGYCLTQHYKDIGHYPSTADGLKALAVAPKGPDGAKWNGPYTQWRKVQFNDEWGQDLQYKCPGVHNPKTYDLWSYGADGKDGGKGFNADIGNW